MNQPDSLERDAILEGIAEGLAHLIKTLLSTPLINRPLRRSIDTFRENTETYNLDNTQVGEIALLIFNELNCILGREQLSTPEKKPPSQEITTTVRSTMSSVHKVLSMPPPIPAICRPILGKAVNRCKELIAEHSLGPQEIEQIGAMTWERVNVATTNHKGYSTSFS